MNASPLSPLQKRLRTSARIALYGSLTLATSLGAVFLPIADLGSRASLDQSWFEVDFDVPEVEMLREFLQIDTSPTGSELEGARYLASKLAEVGLESHIEELPGGRANLWAVVEGKTPRALVLHNHLDVEPVRDPSAWSKEPFGGEIELPWIYGRGAFDMKSVTIAQLEAVRAVQRRVLETGEPPEVSLVFLATSSEESGSDLGTRRVLAQHPDLVSRFAAVLTEGGVLEATDRRQVKYWGTSFAQKRYVNVFFCSPSRERLEALIEDIRAFSNTSHADRAPREVLEFLAAYAHTRANPQYRWALERPAQVLRDPMAYDRLPPYLKAMFRDEVAPFPVEEAPGGGGFQVRVSVHLLPGSDFEDARRRLLPEWMTFGLHSTVVDPDAADHGSPFDHPVIAAIDRELTERYGDVGHGPYFLPFYANDARFFRRYGIPSWGFTPFQFLSSDSLTMNQPNERIALPEFLEGVELYRSLVRRLVAPEAPVSPENPTL